RLAYNVGLPFWEHFVDSWNRYCKVIHILPPHISSSDTDAFATLLGKLISELQREMTQRRQVAKIPDVIQERAIIVSHRVKRLLSFGFARILISFIGISAGLLPISPIIILSKVPKHQVLGYIALLTSLFTLGLMFLILMES
ncbi:hypothetical protein N431DRAFT_353815, partial [Stipitochalara longipes BDJ]